ncbi:hypothetical protein PISMIDRAFT_223381 [Pisolithus microcarpus 441]|uniref:Uncharacterized protein n=1 Tax=Pisolithus microcarpus 441 TaxID=765257 RepID=A0A0C9ZC96_9AGAM|nr:hypothetical protein PISMIDRAFT_223381 [Pisolithus microcarpus 441]
MPISLLPTASYAKGRAVDATTHKQDTVPRGKALCNTSRANSILPSLRSPPYQ